MAPNAKSNGFNTVKGHLNTMDTLLSKMNAKLRGVPYQPKTGNNKHVGNNAGNSPLSNIQVNAEPNRPARGNGLGNNPLEAIQVNNNKTQYNKGKNAAKNAANVGALGHQNVTSKLNANRNAKLKNLTKNVTLSNVNNKANNGLGNNPLEAINVKEKQDGGRRRRHRSRKGSRKSRKHRKHTRRH
jgi:hypothetical protein